MQPFDVSSLPPTSALAAVARSSATTPDFLVADRFGPGLLAARWRRRISTLCEPARLDEHLLSYCTSGGAESTIMIDGVRLHAHQQAGSVTYLPAGRPVQWQLEAPHDVVHVHLYIPKAAMGEAANAPTIHEGRVPPLQGLLNLRDPWLDGYFRLMIAEYEASERDGRLDAFDFLDCTGSLLVRYLRSLQARLSRRALPSAAGTRVSPLRPMVVRRIEEFVERNLSANIHLEDLAAVASMSVDHFVRAFRQATGSTPHRYLLERRLDHASTLLRTSTDRVSRIALRCGLSPAHFTATFHERHGMTPTEFRRMP